MILGQDKAVEAFLASWRSGTPHHAWLLTGPKGVGKATFARAAALNMLAHASGQGTEGLAVPDDHPTAKLMAAGSHPDFRWLKREMNKSGTNLARNISIEQVRSLGPFFGLTSSLGDARVVVIDSVDDLENEAANALLKMLEEPPANAFFLLVSHAPGRLLPTIRSRCRTLAFQPLPDDAMTSLLERERPNDSPSARAKLVALAQGSAGRALAIAEHDLAKLADAARTLMREGDASGQRRSALAKSLSAKASADRYREFLAMLPGLVAEEAKAADGTRREKLLDGYAEMRRTAILAPRLSQDPASTVYFLGTKLADAAG